MERQVEPISATRGESTQVAQTILHEACPPLEIGAGWVFALNLSAADPLGLELVAAATGNDGLSRSALHALGWQALEHLVPAPEPIIHRYLTTWLPPGDPAFAVAEAHDLRCWATVPLLVEDRPVGVLLAARRRTWRRSSRQMLAFVARQIAASLESARLFDESQHTLHRVKERNTELNVIVQERRRLEQELTRRNRELAAVNQLVQTLNSSLELDAVLRVAMDSIVELVGVDAISIRLVDGEQLLLVGSRGLSTEYLSKRATVPVDFSLSGQVVQTGEPLIVEDCASDPRMDRMLVAHERIASSTWMPLQANGRTVGVLIAIRRRRRQFTAHELHILTALAGPVGAALDRARLYDAERRRAQTLEDLSQLKSDFVSTVSHELRTPMSIVKASLDALAANWSTLPDDRRRSYLAIGRQGASRLKRLLDDLLLVSRIENGHLTPRTEAICVSEVVADVVAELRHQHVDRQIDLHFPPDLPDVVADRGSLWEVLLNLIDNAAKYSSADSTIDVRAYERGEEIVIDVMDRGIGIAAVDYGRLFRRFERIDQAVRSRTGTGLGLYICKQLVEAMGGRIWVQSEPGEGSVFSVALHRVCAAERSE